MKKILPVSIIFMISVVFSIYADEQKEAAPSIKKNEQTPDQSKKSGEQSRWVEHFRLLSEKFMNYKMESPGPNAPESVKKAIEKIYNLRKKQGSVFKAMSEAYAKNDLEAIRKAEKERYRIEKEVMIAEKEKMFAWTFAAIEEAQKAYPDSEEIKNLSENLKKNIEEFLSVQNEITKLDEKRMQVEDNIAIAEKRINIIKQKEKVKKSEKNTNNKKQ